jgi:hypothetical protein
MFDRCRAWRSLLTRRAEGMLSPAERALLDDHVSKCKACQKIEAADSALQSICFSRDGGLAAGGRAFDDRVVAELRSFPLVEHRDRGLGAVVQACSSRLSFEFCLQLAGGGLAAAAITAFVLVSALNPVQSVKSLSAYEVRSMSSAEQNEPPVPLESLFQSPAPRAAMLWAAPGRSPRRPTTVRALAAPHAAAPPSGSHSPQRHGERMRTGSILLG